MLGALGMIEKSEYSNSGELVGLEGEEMTDETLQYLNGLDFVRKYKLMRKMLARPNISKGSRAEMEAFFGELPKHIKEGLNTGKLRLADTVIYGIKPINGAKTIKLFETQDIKEAGLRNISNGKLPKNSALLVSGIYLLQGVAAGLTNDAIKAATFTGIDTVGAISSGEFTIKANKKQIVDGTSNVVFKTTGLNTVPVGYYKLANPRLIHDDVEIEFEIELGSVTGIPADTVLYVGMHGTITIP